MVVHLAATKELALERATPAYDWWQTKLRGLVPGSDGKPVAKSYENYVSAYSGENESIDFSLRAQAARRLALVTDPDDAREFVTELRETVNLKHFSCFMRFGGLPNDQVKESMRLWATEVMPALRDSEPVSTTT